ncbi:hypothetical protein BDZ45DRAFT_802799 [Acephala macrosclerotiorum]|nr:hypothetical protein BDZ45DRAFT_802799 [Acephala macrosclerotiorum]
MTVRLKHLHTPREPPIRGTINYIGSGCVVHIPGLLKELTDTESKGISDARQRLPISEEIMSFWISTRELMDSKRQSLAQGKSVPLGKELVYMRLLLGSYLDEPEIC